MTLQLRVSLQGTDASCHHESSALLRAASAVHMHICNYNSQPAAIISLNSTVTCFSHGTTKFTCQIC